MKDISLVFSIIFFAISAISVFFGIYAFIINTNKKTRWTFLFISLSFAIWSLGLSVAVSAPSERICLIWRQTAAIGWGTFYCFLLHYFIQLTEKKISLRKWWESVIIYIPAVITVAAFSFYTGLNPSQYNLIHTNMGWINVAENTAWDWFYIVYYVSYTLIGLMLVWRWGRNSDDISVKKQTRLILTTIIFAAIMCTLSDMLFNSVFNITIPQISPIIFLIPIIAIYYSIKKYGLMNPNIAGNEENILTERTRLRVFKFLCVAFFAGGMLNIFAQYIENKNDMGSAIPFTAIIFLLGLLIYFLLRLKIGETTKELLIVVILCLSIPVIVLNFAYCAGVTVWAYPFILIIITIVFSKRYVLISIAISTVLTQVIIWMTVPEMTVQINAEDYVVRIVLLVFAIIFAIFENKACSLRLKENAEQIAYQKIISEISSDFLTVNSIKFNEKLNSILKDIGVFFKMDRVYVLLMGEEQNDLRGVYEWCGTRTQPLQDRMGTLKPDNFPLWTSQIEDINKLSEDAKELKKMLEAREARSTVSMPIEGEGNIFGFLGLDSVKPAKKWGEDRLKMLRTLANLIADALSKVRAEKEIEHLAYYDHLTNLPNRTLFKDRLIKAIVSAHNTGKLLGIVFIDLDSFKYVNDSMGHSDGDILIKEVSKTFAHRVREADTIARFGGDEFIILLNDMPDIKDIKKKISGLMKIFEKPFMLKGQELFITASAGIAVYPSDGDDTETLIKNADIAMYKAKSRGKNQYAFCTTEMKNEVQVSTMLTNSLYHAEERNELVIYYQPQIDISTGRITGMEALLRWMHPQLGMISPVVFIPLAEKSGLINSIGHWVLKNACIQNKKWQDMGLPPIRVAVNLSVNQFRNPNLVDEVKKIIEESGISPEYIELEITESIAIKEPEYIIDTLNALKEFGVSISIDDFGTEYSSLSRLKDLPADRIKIDMRFVKGIGENLKDQAITMIIINLAKSLGLKVIAEGVETLPQLDFLNQKMCDEAQGFYYYKPMPADKIEEILKAV